MEVEPPDLVLRTPIARVECLVKDGSIQRLTVDVATGWNADNPQGMNAQQLMRLASGIRGSVTTPDDETFDDARAVWNGAVDHRPALIVGCAGPGDVAEAVRFARVHDLGVSVRSAGHHVAGLSVLEGGLVIDLSAMRAVKVDPATRTVRAEGGAQIGDVDAATQQHGLVVPLGVVSETGVAGLTLAGGYGWLRRKHGLACDNVTGVDLVTADGRQVHASADENADLFWALRGAGWDLGVVTAIEYRAHPLGPDVFLPFLTYPLDEGRQVLAGLREFARTAPRDFGGLAVCWTFPDAEPFPQDLWGKDFVAIVGPYAGDIAEGQRISEELHGLGTVLTDMGAVVPWAEAQRFFDEDYPRGRRYYWKSTRVKDLHPPVAEVLVQLGARRPSPLSSIDLWVNGGAIADVPADATPIEDRTAPFMVAVEANWDDPADDAANRACARAVVDALEPHSTGSVYLNFDDVADDGSLRRAHGTNGARLAEVKQRYDPDNLFRSRGLRA